MNIINKLLFDAALVAENELISLCEIGVNEHEEIYVRAEGRYEGLCDLISATGLQEEFEIYQESKKNETIETE